MSTMKLDHVNWPNLLKSKYIKPLQSPSLGVNRMWVKRNDHAPISECGELLKIY